MRRVLAETAAVVFWAVLIITVGYIAIAYLLPALVDWWYITTHCTMVLGTRVCQ